MLYVYGIGLFSIGIGVMTWFGHFISDPALTGFAIGVVLVSWGLFVCIVSKE